ncbi:uncharacterized protein TNCV_1360891 [Trichonephila clavipes]|nr:uncharacterized protein TNCV_1360891 [Trichonephila clavipes]
MSLTTCNHMCWHSCNGSQKPFFNKIMLGITRKVYYKTTSHCYYPSLACPIPRFVSNQAYLGTFRAKSWESQEFERASGKAKANMERNVSRHHTDILRLNEQSCQVIYSQFGLAIHQNDHQARRIFVKWAQNEIAVVPDFHKRILFSDEAHFWLNGYVNKQNCRIWSEANPQVYVETPLHPEKLTVWCALWAGGILLQK